MLQSKKSVLAPLFVLGALVALPARGQVSSTRLSLPKGPGSVEGLASAPLSPSLSSGQASYTIPIEVPPGAAGLAPSLALTYDSGSGIGELGLGWRVSGIASVRPRTQEGLPHFDETDSLEIVGLGRSSELLEVSPGTYRPRFEDGSFLRAQRLAGEWEVRTKSGLVHRFGGSDAVLAADGDVASYLLRTTHDLRGHELSYEWRTDGNFPLLERVVWNDVGPEHRNEVWFEYEARPDRMRLHSLGIPQELAERLLRITVTHGGQLVRRYELSYSDHTHPRLVALSLVGTDGTSRLPEVHFAYTELGRSGDTTGQLVEMPHPPGRSPADADVALSDLNGDGLPDLLLGAAGSYQSLVNVDGVNWEPAREWGPSESPSFSLSAAGVQLADLDGDGAVDLLVSGGDGARYLHGATDAAFGGETVLEGGLDLSFEDPNVRLADFDGDRRIDVAMTTPSGLVVVRNQGGVGFEEAAPPRSIDAEQEVLFEHPGTDLCDVNGDRVGDICMLRSGALVYYLGRGRGAFERAEEGTGVPEFQDGDPFVLRDLDGDGWDDLVRVGVTEVTYALAYGEGQFGDPRSLIDVPVREPSTYVTFADMNGSGSVDIVWIDVATSAEPSWRYLELFPDGRAGLLTEIDSGTGKRQRIDYASAASFAASARLQASPWSSRLNLAMPVVARVTTDTGLGDPVMVQEFFYQEGSYDPSERTFAAFGAATVVAHGDEWTPTLVTERLFDAGLSQPTLRGAVLWQEERALDGTTFSRRSWEYALGDLESALDGRPVSYGYVSAAITELVEGKGESAVTLVETEHDEFGNVISEHDWGVVKDGDYLQGHDEAITERTFANHTSEWVLGRLATEVLRNGSGDVVSATRRYYDGAAFSGLPLGEVTRGELVREEAWVGPGSDDYELVLATRYDGEGLPVETKDARGGGRFFVWDESHTSVVGEGVKLHPDDVLESVSLLERAEVDGRFGSVSAVTDHTGATTRYEYDAFGRLGAIIRPGDSSALPTVRHSYEDAAPLSRVVTESRIESGKAAAELREDVFDGMGRKRASFVLDAELWLLAGVNLYDARGEVRLSTVPRWVSEHERKSPPLGEGGDGQELWRDALGREVRSESAEGVVLRTSYEPLRAVRWREDTGGDTASSTPIATSFDGRGRVVRHERSFEGELLSAAYDYDAAGRLTRRLDPDGHEQRFRYDGRGRRVEVQDPDQGLHRFSYDSSGNLLTHESPSGRTQTTYDLASRLLSEDWNDDGRAEVIREYDVGASENLGKLVRVVEPSGETRSSYDRRGQAIETTHRIEGREYRVRRKFDAQGRQVEHEYPDGSRIELGWNARGLPSSYGDLVRVQYEARGAEKERRYSTGVALRREHDLDGRPLELEFLSAARIEVEHLTFSYDGRGQLAHKVDERQSPELDRSEAYTYDELERLSGVSGSWGSIDFEYSPAGNLLQRRSTLLTQDVGKLRYGDLAHAPTGLGKRALTYDERGRMTSDGERTYVWDGASHLASVSAGLARVDSVYGHDGQRRVRREASPGGARSVTHFIDAWSEVKDGQLVRYVVHGGERIIRLSAEPRAPGRPSGGGADRGEPWGRARYGLWGTFGAFLTLSLVLFASGRRTGRGLLQARPLILAAATCAGLLVGCSGRSDEGEVIGELVPGDVLFVTDQVGSLLLEASEQGEPLSRLGLTPFGLSVQGDSLETNQFAGNPRDLGVQLDHMGARFYAPDLGIWTSADPVSLFEPERQVTSEFAAAHSYAYASWRPTVVVDRDGRYSRVLIGTAIGAVVGGTIEATRQYLTYGSVRNPGLVGAAALGGGIAGLITSTTPAAGLAISAAGGGIGKVTTGIVTRLIESGGRSAGTPEQIGTDFAMGALGGFVTRGATTGLQNVASKFGVQAPVLPRVAAGADEASEIGSRGVTAGVVAGGQAAAPTAGSSVGPGGSADASGTAGAPSPWTAGGTFAAAAFFPTSGAGLTGGWSWVWGS